MDITRKYEHKDHGVVGEVELAVPAEGWALNGKALGEASVKYLATFALQCFQDAYAGAADAIEAQADFDKKVDRVIAGTIGVREGGTRDRVKRRAIEIALRHVPIIKAKDKDGKDVRDDKAMRAAALKRVEKNPAFMALAQSQIDEEAALGDIGDDEDNE